MIKNRPFRERLGFACAGIGEALRGESSFRVQCFFALLVVAILAWLQPSALWWAMILSVTGLVLAAELINTALERVIDHLHPEHHPMMKVAKDCAAGAVLVTALTATIVFIAFLVAAGNGAIR